uniref:Uncharacterized protein n=1 Tax=Sipha flava TaxID=143950 RepID=A0A2S2Q0Z2_9HEMI
MLAGMPTLSPGLPPPTPRLRIRRNISPYTHARTLPVSHTQVPAIYLDHTLCSRVRRKVSGRRYRPQDKRRLFYHCRCCDQSSRETGIKAISRKTFKNHLCGSQRKRKGS